MPGASGLFGRRAAVCLGLVCFAVLASVLAAQVGRARPTPASSAATRPTPTQPSTTQVSLVDDEAAELLALHGRTPTADGLFRHEANYPPLRVTWGVHRQLQNVLGVYPHPVLPGRVLAATGSGVVLSEDAGQTWTALAQATADQVGVVRHVEFAPDALDTIYLASETKGVWAGTDGGKTFRRIGSRQNGLADDATTGVYVYPGDPSCKTLLVTHGDAAFGVSKSDDGGQAWSIIGGEYHIRKIIRGEPGDPIIFLFGSRKQFPEIQSVYSCSLLGEGWQESIRDVVPIDGAFSVLKGGPFVATADSGLCRLSGDGVFSTRVGPEDVTRWSSVGVTWGANADCQIAYAYEPTKLGMVVSADGFKTFWTAGTGLYTSEFIKEGAHIRANATGTGFYAVVNGVLYVGRVRLQPVAVSDVRVTPAVLSFARQSYDLAMTKVEKQFQAFSKEPRASAAARGLMEAVRESRNVLSAEEVTITARVSGPQGAGAGEKVAVTVDLSRLGGAAGTPMFDDGRHGDGTAGDGVYGAVLDVNPRQLRQNPRDWRRTWPGRLGLTVTGACQDAGSSDNTAGAVGVLTVFSRLESFVYWDELASRAQYAVQGDANVEIGGPAEAYAGGKCLKLTVRGGQWSLPFQRDSRKVSIAGYYAMSFRVKADPQTPGEELYVQLKDNPNFSMPVTTPKVPVVREKLVQGGAITGQYRRVIIPIHRFLKDVPTFQPQLLQWIILSGEGRSAGTYWIDRVEFHATAEDIKSGRVVEGEPSDG